MSIYTQIACEAPTFKQAVAQAHDWISRARRQRLAGWRAGSAACLDVAKVYRLWAKQTARVDR